MHSPLAVQLYPPVCVLLQHLLLGCCVLLTGAGAERVLEQQQLVQSGEQAWEEQAAAAA